MNEEDDYWEMQVCAVRLARCCKTGHEFWRRMEEFFPEYPRGTIQAMCRETIQRLLENVRLDLLD